MNPKRSSLNAWRFQAGFTLTELLVVIIIIAILGALGFPAMNRIRSSANQSKCIAQLREWGVTFAAYAGDNTGKIEWSRWEPIGTDPTVASVYLPYFTAGSIDLSTKNDSGSYEKLLTMRNCAATKWDKLTSNGPVTYAMIRPSPPEPMVSEFFISKISRPSRFIMMTEALATAKGTLSSAGDFTAHVKPLTLKGTNLRHERGVINSLMGDFSVRTMNWGEIEKDLATWTAY